MIRLKRIAISFFQAMLFGSIVVGISLMFLSMVGVIMISEGVIP